MEPTGTAMVKAAAGVSAVAKKEANGFLRTVLQAPAEALGGLLADPINELRHAHLIKIAARANERLRAAGVSPQAVPLTIIHPALTAASLEGQPDLQEIWANLLANAADPRRLKPLQPSFPAILKELTTREVKMLDTLFKIAEGEVQARSAFPPTSVGFTEFQLSVAFCDAGLAQSPHFRLSAEIRTRSEETLADERELSLCLDVLRRQELLIKNVCMEEKKDKIQGETRGIRYTIPSNTYSLTTTYSFSNLGTAFVSACRAPKPSTP